MIFFYLSTLFCTVTSLLHSSLWIRSSTVSEFLQDASWTGIKVVSPLWCDRGRQGATGQKGIGTTGVRNFVHSKVTLLKFLKPDTSRLRNLTLGDENVPWRRGNYENSCNSIIIFLIHCNCLRISITSVIFCTFWTMRISACFEFWLALDDTRFLRVSFL